MEGGTFGADEAAFEEFLLLAFFARLARQSFCKIACVNGCFGVEGEGRSSSFNVFFVALAGTSTFPNGRLVAEAVFCFL